MSLAIFSLLFIFIDAKLINLLAYLEFFPLFLPLLRGIY